MGLKERLREAAQQAQDGLAKGQGKLDQYRTGQAVNDQLQALGQAYWVEQAGRATPSQLQALLEAVAPAIREGESRMGPLPWPDVPAAPTASGPTASGPTASGPTPGPAPGGAAPVPPPTAAPSGMPTAIHHEPPAPD
jgi:hypothetical protein